MDKAEFYRNARHDLTGPLDGVTVIEATTTWAGPMAGCVLADFGATVIKVEHPTGEVGRRTPPILPDTQLSIFNETVNRNKQNVALNLQDTDGREAFLKLCATADIVVENFRPGTLHKWGVGYEQVAAVKPDIVFVSVSGFGQFGTYSDRVGYDPVAQNFCGWTSLNGDPDGGPTKAPTFLGDDLGGLHGALGAMAALRHRDQTGEGQHVDVALVDALLFQSSGHPTAGALDLPIERWGNQFGIAAPVNAYPSKDGNVFCGVLLDTHWQRLCELLQRQDLADLKLMQRIEQRDLVDGVLAEYCADHTVAEVVDAMTELGLPATRVNTYAESAKHEHVASRDMLQTVELSDGSNVPITGPAAKFSRTPTKIRNAAAPLGGDTVSVMHNLGYTDEDIAKLRSAGVLVG